MKKSNDKKNDVMERVTIKCFNHFIAINKPCILVCKQAVLRKYKGVLNALNDYALLDKNNVNKLVTIIKQCTVEEPKTIKGKQVDNSLF